MCFSCAVGHVNTFGDMFSQPFEGAGFFLTQNVTTDQGPVWTPPFSPRRRGRQPSGPLSRTWRRTSWAKEEEATPGALGTPPAPFPAAPRFPGFSVTAASARRRGQRFLTAWVTAVRPGTGLIGGVTIPLLGFSSLPCSLTSAHFRITEDPRSAPPGTRAFPPLPMPINVSHLHENVQKMSFYIINYILQVIKILQPCSQQQPIHQQR